MWCYGNTYKQHILDLKCPGEQIDMSLHFFTQTHVMNVSCWAGLGSGGPRLASSPDRTGPRSWTSLLYNHAGGQVASSGGRLAWMQPAKVRAAKAKGTECSCQSPVETTGRARLWWCLLPVFAKGTVTPSHWAETSSHASKGYHSPSQPNCRCYSNPRTCTPLICL